MNLFHPELTQMLEFTYLLMLRFGTHESQAHKLTQAEIEMQNTLADLVIGESRWVFIASQQTHKERHNVCQWPSHEIGQHAFKVRCDNGVWTRISMIKVASRLHLEFLPQSIKKMRVIDCQQRYEFSTRLLPARAESVSLAQNALCGSLDLEVLPLPMRHLDFSYNAFSGPISFTHLPPQLVSIDLSFIILSQDCVGYGHLPIGLEAAVLNECGVMNLISVEKDQSAVQLAKRVFSGVQFIG